jgi:DNA-directed RNA polymerase specialized sigma subunit
MTSKDPLKELLNSPSTPAWQRYNRGDESAASGALKELQPTIDSAIHSFAGDDPSYRTQARILTLNAIKTYDASQKANIKTHVFNHLQRLKRLSAQRGNLTHISEEAATQRLAIERARRAWEIDNGDDPTVEELATVTGISRERIDALSNYRPVTPDSLAVSPEGDSMAVADVDRALTMYDRYIYDELDRTDKKIYEWSTGYGGVRKIPRSEMARKLRMSEAAVSKRASRIATKFNQDREMFRREFHSGYQG